MKRFFTLLLLIQAGMVLAQKPRTLQATDPLVGNWKFNADSSGHRTTAPLLSGAEIISLLPGLEVGLIAGSYEPKSGKYFMVSYFVARKDSAKIYGEVSESDNPQWNGKTFSCKYEYRKDSDMLVLRVGDKKYYYSRTQ